MEDNDSEADDISDPLDTAAGSEVVALAAPEVCSTAETTRRLGKDGRFGSICIVLSHVTKNQDIVRTSLETEFGFTCIVDGHDKTKQGMYLGPDFSWGTRTFCIVDHASVGRWIARAEAESRRPDTQCVVCLCPARTNTDYFHDIVLPYATSIRFIRGRLCMPGHKRQSPFPSCVVVFGAPAVETALPTMFSRPAN